MKNKIIMNKKINTRELPQTIDINVDKSGGIYILLTIEVDSKHYVENPIDFKITINDSIIDMRKENNENIGENIRMFYIYTGYIKENDDIRIELYKNEQKTTADINILVMKYNV